ncbi:MAG: polyphosphate polymerase domain-containing protein [Acutalibacteraceae bacterium]
MKYRHEWKHEISYGDMLVLRQRLSAVMKRDAHTIESKYSIRSLYFDNASDKALREKIDGVNVREKFRIRYYNNDISLIHLEKKSKVNGLCLKDSAALSAEQAQAIVNGDYAWMADSGVPLVQELYSKMMSQGLRPKTIVDYLREPFVFAPGNVRVTLDYNIRTGMNCKDFLNRDCITVPAGDAPIILEVKWDEYLPDIIRDAVQLSNCRVGAFSKYAMCRIYG